MIYTQTCPRCGCELSGEEREAVAAEVVEHARVDHGHAVSHEQIVSHLDEQLDDEG